MYDCEAGCGHVEWIVTLASCKVFFLCGEKALRMLTLAGEVGCSSHIASLRGAAMELASHYCAEVGIDERSDLPRDIEDEKVREFTRLHWRNRAAE